MSFTGAGGVDRPVPMQNRDTEHDRIGTGVWDKLGSAIYIAARFSFHSNNETSGASEHAPMIIRNPRSGVGFARPEKKKKESILSSDQHPKSADSKHYEFFFFL